MTTITLPYQSVQAPREYAGYLQALWNLQQVRYELNWRLYTGEAWLEVDTRKKDRVGDQARRAAQAEEQSQGDHKRRNRPACADPAGRAVDKYLLGQDYDDGQTQRPALFDGQNP